MLDEKYTLKQEEHGSGCMNPSYIRQCTTYYDYDMTIKVDIHFKL